MIRVFSILGSLIVVVGCGGGSTGNETQPYVSYVAKTPTSFSEAKQFGLSQINAVNSYIEISVSDVPSGTYTYNGFASVADGTSFPTDYADYGLISNLTLNANFDNNSLTGTMHNFQNSVGSLSGTVNVNGSISGKDVSATTSGVLSQSGMTINNSGTMSGRFLGKHISGETATAVGGTMSGTSGSSNYVGLFTGER